MTVLTPGTPTFEGMDTKELFAQLIQDKDRCLGLGMTYDNWRNIKSRFARADPMLRESAMEEWLVKAGYTKKTTWVDPQATATAPKLLDTLEDLERYFMKQSRRSKWAARLYEDIQAASDTVRGATPEDCPYCGNSV